MSFISTILLLVVVIILAIIAWKVRLLSINSKYVLNMEWVLLEIRVPRDVYKSPLAMELIIQSFYQTWPGHWHDKYIKGIVRNWFSLEIISVEGRIYFLMYIPKFYKNLIESQIYSQYPRVEINEVPDYTKMIPPYRKGGSWDLYGYEFGLRRPYAWPIKTYIDYDLDKAVGSLEEIEKIDPITPLLEFLGSISPGEHIWIQILVRASKKRNWRGECSELINDLKARFSRVGAEEEGRLLVTRDIQSAIDKIDRKRSKPGFDCGIRSLYLAERNSFNVATRVALRGVLNAFGSESLNSFRRPLNTNLEWPWKRIMKFRVTWRKKRMFKAYSKRFFFYFPYWLYFWPFQTKSFVLNTEEIATIYHYPGMVSETPTFKRIEFKKSEPPPDLPV